MSQSVQGARSALYAALKEMFADAKDEGGAPLYVSYGLPGSYQPDQIVAVMNTRRPVEAATMGTNRSRRSAAEIDVAFSVYVPGGGDPDSAYVTQQVASDKCDDLVDVLLNYLRTGTNLTLGGTCREATVTNVNGPIPTPVTGENNAVTGRAADSIVTVTVHLDY